MEKMKTLTIGNTQFDIYDDEAVRFTEQTLTAEQKAQARANIGVSEGNDIEPAEEDIPKVFFGAALPQTKDDTVMTIRYISKTEDISGYCKTKAQGNSSMDYPKKNQTVKLYKDADCAEKLEVNFKGWGKQNKFCFKANFSDLTHARNIVSSRLWGDVVKSRADYNTIPELLRTSPNQGAVDGFPVKVYADGIYQGRYTINIPKDAWMANMDENQETHCILCGENYGSGCFRAEAKIDESDWTDEIHDTVPASIKNRWNEAIRFVMNSTDEEFVAGIGNYFDVDSLIDYYIFGLVTCNNDGFGKNQLYMTYDGMKWYATVYDLDNTFGTYLGSVKPYDFPRESYEDYVHNDGNLLYVRMEELFKEEIAARWEELKSGALSVENIINRFERFTDIAPLELVKEDYASTTAGGAFTGIPLREQSNIQQIRGNIHDRRAYCSLKLNPPEGALYPFVGGSKQWQVGETTVNLETTNGNHVKLSYVGVIATSVAVNISTPATNTDGIFYYDNFAAGNPKFTLRSGDEVRVVCKHSAGSDKAALIEIRAGGYTLVAERAGDYEYTVTLEEDVPVPDFGMVLYLWSNAADYKYQVEFDIEIYVNGVQYV